MKKYLIALACLSMAASVSAQKFEGLAETPPMGWNSWNKFASNINEEVIMGMCDAMVETGLRDAGYIYLNIDDCWHGQRDENGFIQADEKKFPHGLKYVTDYAHSKGLKVGIYSDAGRKTCGGHPGSLGHEYQDALQYAKWGFDYLKYDWCNTEDVNPRGAYTLMRDALHAAGRPIVFSMCEWGQSRPWTWAQEVGHLWRTTGDIGISFDQDMEKDGWHPQNVLQIIDQNEPLRDGAGPGHWNDPDMLEVGNGMSVNEDRAHFSMWCMMAAPLILGNDLRNMSEDTKAIIFNKDVIAVDQDPLGIQGYRYKREGDLELWFKPLSNDAWAFCILNRGNEVKEYTIDWLGLDQWDYLSKRFTNFDSKVYNVKNVWTGNAEGTTKQNRTVTVPGHDVVMYTLTVAPVKNKKK